MMHGPYSNETEWGVIMLGVPTQEPWKAFKEEQQRTMAA